MRILTAVTCVAFFRGAHIELARLRMTRFAAQVFVLPAKGKLGLAAVIKCPDVPSVGVVTPCTLGAQGLSVGVVLAVAIHAVHLCIVELRIRMAIFTGQGRVQPE